MDRVHRSGLVALILLFLIAVAGLTLGGGEPTESEVRPRHATFDPQMAVNLLGPEERAVMLQPGHFRSEPVRHPLRGGDGREPRAAITLEENAALEIDFDRRAPAPAASPPGRVIRVRENENLITIAKQELGDASRWEEIAALNGITDPKKLGIGQVLYLPRKGEPRPAATPTRETPWPAPELAPAGPAGVRRYKVLPGETPGEISQKLYGTVRHWRALLEANGIQDPRDLRAGDVITIPPLR